MQNSPSSTSRRRTWLLTASAMLTQTYGCRCTKLVVPSCGVTYVDLCNHMTLRPSLVCLAEKPRIVNVHTGLCSHHRIHQPGRGVCQLRCEALVS